MTLKRTYTLPADIVERFEAATAPGKRSATLATIMADWIARKHREELSREIVDGCREMAETYLAVEKEYHALEEEVERGARTTRNEKPQAGKRRSRSA